MLHLFTCHAYAEKKIILTVGVNKLDSTFKGIKPLNHAVSDAEKMCERFQGNGFECRSLHNPTLQEVRAEILKLEKLKTEENDTIILYFSMHGLQVRQGLEIKRYLVMKDTKADDYDSALDLDDVKRMLNFKKIKHRAIILDACQQGVKSIEGKKGVLKSSSSSLYLVLSGSAEGGNSYEAPRLNEEIGGLYTHYLLESMAISEDQTLFMAHHRAARIVEEISGKVQLPSWTGFQTGSSAVIYTNDPNASSRPSRTTFGYWSHDLNVKLTMNDREVPALNAKGGFSPANIVELKSGGIQHLKAWKNGKVINSKYVRIKEGEQNIVDDFLKEAYSSSVDISYLNTSSSGFRHHGLGLKFNHLDNYVSFSWASGSEAHKAQGFEDTRDITLRREVLRADFGKEYVYPLTTIGSFEVNANGQLFLSWMDSRTYGENKYFPKHEFSSAPGGGIGAGLRFDNGEYSIGLQGNIAYYSDFKGYQESVKSLQVNIGVYRW